MTEPIKLPPIPYPPVHLPSLFDGKLPEYREAHMRGYAVLAVEQKTAALEAKLSLAVERLNAAVHVRDELRARVAELEFALQYMLNCCPPIDPSGEAAVESARAALKEKQT